MNKQQEQKEIIKFQNVTFGYTSKMINIDDVTFSIKENEYVCVIGHNGSGKSTISKLMAGLITPNSGEIRINDTIINNENIRAIRNNIGIIFQNPDNQFVGLTVEDDIAFGLENKKVPHTKMKQIINLAATATGITNLLEAEPASLSGGQKQRVAIAGVLATNPKIIIFDESTSMLDPNAKQDLKKLMLDLKNNYGKTIVSVTHDMEEVTSADKIIIMNKGKVLKIASPEEVFSDREFLLNIKLDVPFNLHLCMELQKLSKHKDDYPLTTDLHKLVKEIWAQKK